MVTRCSDGLVDGDQRGVRTGNSALEAQVLLASYRHLSPLANLVRSSTPGVEEGATAPARPRPPLPASLSIADELAREWYRLVGRS
jgi:hypothetical protein